MHDRLIDLSGIMAEGHSGHSAIQGMGDWREERSRVRQVAKQVEKERNIKKLFSSAQWYYPVHKYIGDIVQNNKFSVDYQPELKWICFQWYCDTVTDFMIYLVDWETTAAAVLRVLPTRKNVIKGLPLDPVVVISEKDAIYVLGTYNLECFDYLLRSFAIELKESCLGFVEKQLRELIEKEPVLENLKQPLKDFASGQSQKLVEEQKETIKGIETTCANKNLSGIKRTTPLSFILSEEIDPKKMPSPPRDPEQWEDYFLQVCSERLTLTLAKEKDQWDADASEPRACLRPRMINQFKRLKDILKYPGTPPEKRPYSFHVYMTKFREEINKLISKRH